MKNRNHLRHKYLYHTNEGTSMEIKKNFNNVFLIEPHPKNYKGYPFITVVQYNKEHFLTIIDNVNDKSIIGYVLDKCGPEGLSESLIIEVSERWYRNSKDLHPLSIEFSKLSMANTTSKILKSFNIEFVTRIIGPLFYFPMDGHTKIKRRKRRPLPPSIQINIVKLHE